MAEVRVAAAVVAAAEIENFQLCRTFVDEAFLYINGFVDEAVYM